MQSSISFEELEQLTQSVMTKEGIHEYDIDMRGHSEKGDNYIGDVMFFRVVPKKEKRIYNLVLKAAKRSKELRKNMPIVEAHKRESFMYRIVFPEMRKFLKLFGDEVHLDYVPKIFSVCDDDERETLILENLKHLGYRMLDRKKQLDLEHALLVSKFIGKHHAISFAMSKRVPKTFEKITENMSNFFVDFNWDLQGLYKSLFENACKLLKISGNENLAKKYEKKITDKFLGRIYAEAPVEDRLVICHGDCWNNNILFKFEDSNDSLPTGLCLIDFQLSTLDSPVKDLSFFLYIACNKSVLDRFELVLQTYHASLSENLELLGCKSDDCFTYEKLMDHWTKYAITGVLLSTFFIKAGLLETGEVPEEKGPMDPVEIFCFKMKNEEEYNSRIIDVFTHFGEKFL